MKHNKKGLGILTGGGDCPGLNAVIRAITKTAINVYDYEVIGFIDGFKGLVENQYITLDMETVSGIAHTGGTILGTTNRDNPFRYITGGTPEKPEFTDQSDRAIENIKRLGLEGLIIIGGDGSLNIAQKFFEKGVPIVGVPKTIDNDLSATDVTFGFNTAVDTASEALDRLHTTAESHHRVMILEVMGRYAGWIALHAGISGGADVILIPEIPYDINKVVNKIMQRYRLNKKFSIVVVAEGARAKDGEMVIQKMVPASHDPIRLGGIGHKVAEEIEKLAGVETRVTVLGHLQRGGSPVPYDRILATRYGVAAMDAFARGEFGSMVSLKGTEIVTVPLVEAIKKLRKVPLDSDLIHAAKSVGISFGD
ncbi:6-phosphofructokinase [Thermosyntropha sp.]|uniref:6-phosphofructokinase n=1 Tax=Thermosyntropha sp. TaxID=2740820 RepID=UPI0025E38B55|nr:6-phosphofructokinase [Thermosyntropha sp.]MBO8158424.1 6-phosphofructokinase [Thermosyntropha sp.]